MSSHPAAAAAEAAGRRFRRWLIIFSVAAFLLRLSVAMEIAGTGGGFSSMFRPSPATDLATYMRLGHNVTQKCDRLDGLCHPSHHPDRAKLYGC